MKQINKWWKINPTYCVLTKWKQKLPQNPIQAPHRSVEVAVAWAAQKFGEVHPLAVSSKLRRHYVAFGRLS